MNALETVNQARDAITVRRVYGEPLQQDGVTVIPAAVVMGGGGGGGDAQGNGGSGFGLVARPAGAWVIKDGDALWRGAARRRRGALRQRGRLDRGPAGGLARGITCAGAVQHRRSAGHRKQLVRVVWA